MYEVGTNFISRDQWTYVTTYKLTSSGMLSQTLEYVAFDPNASREKKTK